MGLDATVYCNCFEAGQLREPPPAFCNVVVTDDGSLLCGNDELSVQLAFDEWRHNRACEHEDGKLVHHRIGNIKLVAALREALAHAHEKFPILLERVIYDGTHAGDFLTPDVVHRLRPEIVALASFHCRETDTEQFMRTFAAQMLELTEASLRVGKPLVF